MKLFVNSINLDKAPNFFPYFLELMNTDTSHSAKPRMLVVHNAKDPQGKDKSLEMIKRDKIYGAFNVEYQRLDLLKDEKIREKIHSADALYLGGGNAFYLLYSIIESGAFHIIKEEVSKGLVVGGSSAGAIVMSKSLKYFDIADDTGVVPKIYLEGLGLIEFVPLVHWGNHFFADSLKKIEAELIKDGTASKRITDEEALIIEDGRTRLVRQ